MKSFFLSITIVTAAMFLLGWLVKDGIGLNTYDLLMAVGISLLNVIGGMVLANWGIAKPQGEFMKIVFGGMGIRLTLVAVVIILLIKFEIVARVPFFVALMAFYFIHLLLELYFLNRILPKVYKKKIETE